MDQDKIGLFIQTLRKDHGLTQKQLSQMLGVSDKTISKWETGRGLPDALYLSRLCQILEISVSELLSGEKLSSEIYSERTEKTIVTLLKEKETMNRSRWIQMIVSGILLATGIYLVILQNGISVNAAWYWDSPTLVALILITVSCGLIASIRSKKNLVETLSHIVLPAGSVIRLYQLMNTLIFYDPSYCSMALIICLVSCIQPLLYAFIMYLVLIVIKNFVN